MAIEDRLVEWDGKSADFLMEVYQDHCDQESFVDDLLELIPLPLLEQSATWLFKQHHQQGKSITQTQKRRLVSVLSQLDHWSARVHVLLCLNDWETPRRQLKRVESFVRSNLEHENKFVRACAYGAFCRLAQQYEELVGESETLIEYANEHEPASVRARIRQVLKRK